MKTLANCNPLEFLTQTNKIRKSVENWLELTQVLEIRKSMPQIKPDWTAEEKTEAYRKQVKKNLSDMLAAVLEKYPKETAELLCLCCFIDPKDMENHSMAELISSINEIIGNEEVVGFFVSLARLGLTSGTDSAKA